MASTSEVSAPATVPSEAPCRDDPSDAEFTPLMAGGEASVSRNTEEPGDEEQGTTTAQSPEDGTPRRQFNYIRFHRASLILAVIVLVNLIGFVVFAAAGQEIGFHFPGRFEEPCVKALVLALFTVVWASIALHRHRKKQPPLSLALGTVVHGVLSFFIFAALAGSTYVLDLYPSSMCWGYRDGHDRCEVLSLVFWWICLGYVGVLLALATLQCILFVACLTPTYRRHLGVNGSEHGFSLPGGQISVEFTIRFLRQDAPPPAPIRGVSPLVPAPPSTSVAPHAPAPVAEPLIATE